MAIGHQVAECLLSQSLVQVHLRGGVVWPGQLTVANVRDHSPKICVNQDSTGSRPVSGGLLTAAHNICRPGTVGCPCVATSMAPATQQIVSSLQVYHVPSLRVHIKRNHRTRHSLTDN
ncbi:hypothetical protein VTK56DRAFT_8477 [Thermocarpiscus australiensis]